jgi:glucokinase
VSLTIGVDVGGTKIAAGVVDEKGAILDRNRLDTPAGQPAAIVSTIVAAAKELAGRHEVTAVGIGAAAFVDAARSTVLFAPNLAWRDTPVREPVAGALGLPVVVENDANAAAWGEFQFGAASDVDDMVLLTIGTGVGGGIVANREIYRGGHGVGGEIGHMLLVRDGQLCGCGLHGCLEAYASGTALVREARAAATAGLPEAAALLERAGGRAEAIDGHAVTAAAHDGDALSIRLLADLGRYLGEGMGSLTSVLDPDVFVVGGGVSDAADLIMVPAREALHQHLTGRGNRPEPEVRLASLGNDAGIVGAADLARR